MNNTNNAALAAAQQALSDQQPNLAELPDESQNREIGEDMQVKQGFGGNQIPLYRNGIMIRDNYGRKPEETAAIKARIEANENPAPPQFDYNSEAFKAALQAETGYADAQFKVDAEKGEVSWVKSTSETAGFGSTLPLARVEARARLIQAQNDLNNFNA